MNEIIGIVAIFILIALFLTGIELGFAMAIIGFLGFSYIVSVPAALNLLAKDFFEVFSSYGLTVIPIFIFMGQIAFNTDIARNLYDSAHKLVGHIPGGLAIATVGGATIFKAICGSSPAIAATFASVAVPEMDKYGYDKKLSTGIVATGGTLGIILPPSVVLIVVGIMTEQSIGKLFMAGIIPGLIIALFFIFIIIGWCKINPSLGPKSDKYPLRERIISLKEIAWPILIFIIVIGGLLKGFFTPTEAGSVGGVSVLVLVMAKRNLSFKGFIKSVRESIAIACMVLMLIGGSYVLGHFITVTNIPMIAADWVTGLPFPPWLIMVIIFLIYELGGSFIDDLAFMILATPIFYPAVIKLGYDPIWFAIMICITVMIGILIPPVAINVFVVQKITKVPFNVIYKGVLPFLLSFIVCGILLFIFPQIVSFLPNIFYK